MAHEFPDESSTDRRTFLATTGLLGAGALAGFDSVSADGSQTDTPEREVPWPQFQRDAGHTGHASDGDGPDGYLTQKWFAPVGSSLSSPLVGNGHAYVTHRDSELYAVNLADGSVSWRQDPYYEHEHKMFTPLSLSTGAVDERAVYLATVSGVAAYDAMTGDVLWQAGLNTRTSVALDDDTVYVVANGDDTEEEYQNERALYALDAETGEYRWEVPLGTITDTDGTPAVADGTVVVAVEDGVYAFDAATGETQWSAGGELPLNGTPSITDGVVYVQRGSDRGETSSHYQVVTALDAETGEERWSSEFETYPHIRDAEQDEYSPAVTDDAVYVTVSVGMHEHALVALDAETGEERWRFARTVTAAPVVVDGKVYVSGEGVTGYSLFVVDAESGQEVTRFRGIGPDGQDRVHYPSLVPPAVVDGVVYFTTYAVSNPSTPTNPTGLYAVHEGDVPSGDGPTDATLTVETDDPRDCVPVAMRAEATTGDGDGYLVHWDFGDDSSFEEEQFGAVADDEEETVGATVEHQLDAGRREVRVVIEDRYGRSTEAIAEFEVRGCADAPSVEVEVVTEEPTVGEPVEFAAHGGGAGVEDDDFEWYINSHNYPDDDPDGAGRNFVETFQRQDARVTVYVTDRDGQVAKDSVALSLTLEC